MAAVSFDRLLVQAMWAKAYTRLDREHVHFSIYASVNDTIFFLSRHPPRTPRSIRRQNHCWYTCFRNFMGRVPPSDHRYIVLARFRMLLLWP